MERRVVIVSHPPLKNAVKALESLAPELKQDRGALDLNREPVEVMGDLLEDLRSDRGGLALRS